MAEGTRFAKLDDAIKSLNEFRSNTEDQIREINNSISRLVELVNQRCEDKHATVSRSTDKATTVNPHSNINMPFHSMKIEVPRFDGTDLPNWIFKIENFFQFYNTPEDQKITISSSHLDGPALSWFNWMYSNGFIESWKGFVKVINFRFGPSLYEDCSGALSKVQETTIAASYQVQFKDLSTKVQDEQDTTILEELNTIEESEDIEKVESGSMVTNYKLLQEEPARRRMQTIAETKEEVVIEKGVTAEAAAEGGIVETTDEATDEKKRMALPIQGIDVVLGIQCLELLGSVITNYKLLTMDFQWNGKKVHLMGNSKVSDELLLGKGLMKLTKYQNIASLFLLKALLNVKPYKYPHFQKSEMEDAELVNREFLAQRLSFKVSQSIFPDEIGDIQVPIKPLAVLNRRNVTDTAMLKSQVLIQWEGSSLEESSWEDLPSLAEKFSQLNLEDQVCFDGRRNVTNAAAG